MILTVISTLLAVLLGYYLGIQRYNRDIKTAVKVAKKIKRIVHTTTTVVTKGPSGIVYRPDAARLSRLKRDKIKSGEMTALKETFDEIPELKKLQQYAKQKR